MTDVAVVHSDRSKKDQPVDDNNPWPTKLVGGTAGIGNVYIIPPATFSDTYAGNQTNVDIITPASGKKLRILQVQVTSDDATFVFVLDFAASAKVVQDHREAGTLGSSPPMNIEGAVDEPLRLNISDSASQNWFLLVNYEEVDP